MEIRADARFTQSMNDFMGKEMHLASRACRLTLVISVYLLAGCSGTPQSDAYGNFEAVEITVSAQADGRLLSLDLQEGDGLEAGAVVGAVDTTLLAARRDNLKAQEANLQAQLVAMRAQERAAQTQVDEADAQADVWRVQRASAEKERDRSRRLLSAEAATAREVDERDAVFDRLAAQVRQAEARIASARAQAEGFAAQAHALLAQIDALSAQYRQVRVQLNDARVVNPQPGTVLAKLAQAGELVRTGSPLYTVAETDPLILRAYATGNQLPALILGMKVDVLFDDGAGGLERREGTVTYIAPQAEFTPTPIQTRDERAELVYAFKVQTPNPDGRLKIGMPGEVRFATNPQ